MLPLLMALLLTGPATARAEPVAVVRTQASSELGAGYRAGLAADGRDETAWCEDGQSVLTTFEKDTAAQYFRIKLRSGAGAPLCLREIYLLKLDESEFL